MEDTAARKGYERLERYDWKLSRTVLRRGEAGNRFFLFGAMALGMENIEYEPEQFPGMVYRVKEPHVVILIFTTGKIVCTGGRNIEDVSKAVEKLSKELNSLGLIH